MTPADALRGRTALVTGAASGIGAATARAFAAEGDAVVLADMQVADGKLATSIRSEDGCALLMRCDMREEAKIEAAVQRAVDEFGALHVAYNNAGIEGEQRSTADCGNENWEQMFTINLRGLWWCMKHKIPRILAVGGGAIISGSSIAGPIRFPCMPAYLASKPAVIGLTKATALEYAKQNTRLNAVCPGVIDTPMIQRFMHGDPAAYEAFAACEPVGRTGKPEEIASAPLWLAGPGVSITTGHAVIVDCGWVAK